MLSTDYARLWQDFNYQKRNKRNGDLKLAEKKLPLNDLSMADGVQWLDSLNARHQWIVISACYSGLLKEALASPNRVGIHLRRPDHNSFGCGDDSKRTWFSAALYGERGWPLRKITVISASPDCC